MSDVETWVSFEYQRLAQVIYDYDKNLSLEMVPVAEQRHLIDKSKVFRIIDERTNSIVMYAHSLSSPIDILTRLWSMDATKGDVLARLDAHNAAIEALENEKIIAEREFAKDFSAFVIKNTKSRWSHGGKIYDDEFRNLGSKSKIIDK